MTVKKKEHWDVYDRYLIKKHFGKITMRELHAMINKSRHISDHVAIGALRHEVRRMGLTNGIQIRWSDRDSKFLKNNYKNKGNVELAQLLNKRKCTYRIINNKKVYRKFKPKNIEAKMKHMGLSRTEADLKSIVKRNREVGLGDRITSDDNWWTRGVLKAAHEGEVRIWKKNGGDRYRVIKVNGVFVPLGRWKFESQIHNIPKGYMLYFLDCDTLNDSIDNLAIQKKGSLDSTDRLKHALELLLRRENQINRELTESHTSRDIEGIKEKRLELNRVRRIMSDIEMKLTKRRKRNEEKEK